MSPMRLGGYLLAGLIAPTLHAQDAAAVVAVEQAAIRYMTKGLADSTVAINPEYVQEGTAPGFPTNRARSAENAQALRAVGFKALKRADAISCVQRECKLHYAAAFVSISQPRIDNDTAQVTVTIDRPGGRPGRLYYETLHLVLKSTPTGWQVVNATQLGIS